MNKNTAKIFSRMYQSYVTGGDIYTYRYNTEAPEEVEIDKGAIHSLEEDGYLSILSMDDRKAKLAITDKGIDYGNDNY